MEKKRIFSISLAIFFTILILIFNYSLNLIWKEEKNNIRIYDKNSPINTIQESFSKIFSNAKPVLEQVFSSSTKDKIIDQINLASSSFSTISNIVE